MSNKKKISKKRNELKKTNYCDILLLNEELKLFAEKYSKIQSVIFSQQMHEAVLNFKRMTGVEVEVGKVGDTISFK